MRYSSEFKERCTMMDVRRNYDKKMKWECIGGMVVMAVVFIMMILALNLWG